MKDIKTFVIGFLTCACMFLIMGQTKSENQIGKYQGWATDDGMFIVDTATGELYLYGTIQNRWRRMSGKEIFKK